MPWIHLNHNDPSVKRIVQAAFPSYRGRHIVATITDRVRFSGTQWDEGNKTDYVIVKLDTLQVHAISDAPFLRPSPFMKTLSRSRPALLLSPITFADGSTLTLLDRPKTFPLCCRRQLN